METKYRITEDDYVNAHNLYARTPRKTWIIYAVGGAVLLCAYFFGDPSIGTPALGGLIGAAVMVSLNRWILRRRVRRIYATHKSIKRDIYVELMESGIKYKSEISESNIPWSDIHKWRQNKDYILCFLSRNLYQIIPKSVQSQGFDMPLLVKSLKEHVGPPQ